jgi:HAD superfamily hydrolase (TIGR01662 family)
VIRGVIFDLGLTLLRFTGDWDEVIEQGNRDLEQFLEDHKLSAPGVMQTFRERLDKNRQERLEDHKERPTAKILQEVLRQSSLPELKAETLERAMQMFYRSSEDKWVPGPHVHSVLKELQSSDYRIGLLSNAGDENNVHRLLSRTDLVQYFDKIVISAGEGVRKPDVSLFKKISSHWQLPEKSVVMVGDSLVQDIHGAQQAGMHQIWFCGNISKDEALGKAGWVKPEFSAMDLAEVPDLLRRIGNGVGLVNG